MQKFTWMVPHEFYMQFYSSYQKGALDSLAGTCNSGCQEHTGVQKAQEPPQAHTTAAGHITVAWGFEKPQSSCPTVPVWGDFHFIYIKRAPSLALAKGSFTPKIHNQTGYKIPRFLHVGICHSAAAPAPPSVLTHPLQKGTTDNLTSAIICSPEPCPQAASAEAETAELCKRTPQLACLPTLCG